MSLCSSPEHTCDSYEVINICFKRISKSVLMVYIVFCICLVPRLQVVSTRVGGVPEVLPPDMIKLAEPSVKCKYSFTMYSK